MLSPEPLPHPIPGWPRVQVGTRGVKLRMWKSSETPLPRMTCFLGMLPGPGGHIDLQSRYRRQYCVTGAGTLGVPAALISGLGFRQGWGWSGPHMDAVSGGQGQGEGLQDVSSTFIVCRDRLSCVYRILVAAFGNIYVFFFSERSQLPFPLCASPPGSHMPVPCGELAARRGSGSRLLSMQGFVEVGAELLPFFFFHACLTAQHKTVPSISLTNVWSSR